MTDETMTQPQSIEAPVTAEAAPAEPAPVDVESIVSERLTKAQQEWEAKLNERVTGFQRLVSERDEEIKRLKTASLSEDEREQLLVEEQEQERQAFEAERWLFTKAKENADAAALFEKVLSLEDPDEQFAVFVDLASRLNAGSQAGQAQEPDLSEQVPDVDPNNPAPRVSPGTPIGPDGQVWDREARQRFLKQFDHWPGM